MSADRRTFERVAVKILAEVFEAGSPKKIGKAKIFNMSCGGAGLESGFIVDEGKKLAIKFHLKKHKYDFSRLLIEGIIDVRWASLNGGKKFYGVQFQKMPNENRRSIKNYLEFIVEKRKKTETGTVPKIGNRPLKRGTGNEKKQL